MTQADILFSITFALLVLSSCVGKGTREGFDALAGMKQSLPTQTIQRANDCFATERLTRLPPLIREDFHEIAIAAGPPLLKSKLIVVFQPRSGPTLHK